MQLQQFDSFLKKLYTIAYILYLDCINYLSYVDFCNWIVIYLIVCHAFCFLVNARVLKLYTVSQKKGVTFTFAITFSNVDRF